METAVRYVSVVTEDMEIKEGELTFEDFQKLALKHKEPVLKGNWIYRMRSYRRFKEEKEYPFMAPIDIEFLFLSKEDAEKKIKKMVKEEADSIYRYIITQIPIGNNVQIQGYSWLYDSKGELIDWTGVNPFGSKYERIFFGRFNHEERFQIGDTVEVKIDDAVYLGVVIQPCFHYIFAFQQFCEDKNYFEDASEDNCLVIIDESLDLISIPVIDTMKPSKEISDEDKKMIKKWMEDYYRKEYPYMFESDES